MWMRSLVASLLCVILVACNTPEPRSHEFDGLFQGTENEGLLIDRLVEGEVDIGALDGPTVSQALQTIRQGAPSVEIVDSAFRLVASYQDALEAERNVIAGITVPDEGLNGESAGRGVGKKSEEAKALADQLKAASKELDDAIDDTKAAVRKSAPEYTQPAFQCVDDAETCEDRSTPNWVCALAYILCSVGSFF